MKRAVAVITSIIILLVLSCSKRPDNPISPPERELSVPEKVEKDLMDVLSKDWKSLSDTFEYFYSSMLSKGIFKGKAPDGVFYELDIKGKDGPALEAEFRIEDSTWAAVNGYIRPLEIKLIAFDTEIAIKKELRDSSSLAVSKVKVIAPLCFLFEDRHQAPLLYEGCRVGYLTRDEFENTDYSTGTYIVAHYYNDPRTFALYDNGFANLMKQNLSDAFK